MTSHMTTAPRDGTEITVTTAGGARVRCRWWGGFLDSTGEPCGCWVATTADYPECWHDGVCWANNADERPSDQPVSWEPTR